MSKSKLLFGSKFCTWFCVFFAVLSGIGGSVIAVFYRNSPSLVNNIMSLLLPPIFGTGIIFIPLTYFLIKRRRDYSRIIVYLTGWGISLMIALVIVYLINIILGGIPFTIEIFYLLILPLITIIYISVIILKLLINKGFRGGKRFKVKNKDRSRLEVLLLDTKPHEIKKVDNFQ